MPVHSKSAAIQSTAGLQTAFKTPSNKRFFDISDILKTTKVLVGRADI
jgi:hypothetical protein